MRQYDAATMFSQKFAEKARARSDFIGCLASSIGPERRAFVRSVVVDHPRLLLESTLLFMQRYPFLGALYNDDPVALLHACLLKE